jgi:hypothetical protein
MCKCTPEIRTPFCGKMGCEDKWSEPESDKKSNSIVNHPSHYGGNTTYEAIKVIEAWRLDFCLGNAVKYISRAGKKDPSKVKEDLEKAVWYLQRKIKSVEGVELE